MRPPLSPLQSQLLAELEIQPSVSRLPDRAIGRELAAVFEELPTTASRRSRSTRPSGMRSDEVDARKHFGNCRIQLDALPNDRSDDDEAAHDQVNKSRGSY